ncbi:hypothetical protein T492DRAFT_1042328, partial [Pavlovales sp. CCMP2436]
MGSSASPPPLPPQRARRGSSPLAALCATLLLFGGGLAAWRALRPCSPRRAFAYATLLTHNVADGKVSPCYRLSMTVLVKSFLASGS